MIISYIVLYVVCLIFFFKQKTAYEMRISDWSSDVCSSDLGYGTVQQILQSLPQAFMGGSNETTTGATTRNGTGNDSTLGSSINLRGLGTNSTLVLIDGARPALGGTGGLFADISTIPMTTVDRL